MSDGKISFSFGSKQKAAEPAPSGKSNLELLMAQAKAKKPAKPVTFDDADDDIALPVKKKEARAAPNLYAPSSSSTKSSTSAPSAPSAPAKRELLSRAERKARDEALKLDASVFDYDGVYDGMKAAEAAVTEARKAAAPTGPKYIESFLAAAATRKLDRLRAEEKMLERERVAEGDEFADKDKFVTPAYQKQMEEVRKAEEEEKAREDAMRRSNKGPGLTSLYASMLDDGAAKHAAAVAATAKTGPSLAIRPPQDFKDEEEYDPLLAAEEKSSRLGAGVRTINADTGKEIEINDDGEVVDKRSLLKAGLNITKKLGPALPPSLISGTREEAKNKPYVSRAVGAAASYHERVARERKRLSEQIVVEEEKKRAAAEAARAEEEEAARRRREGDDGAAAERRMGAKERYLARKREREEEQARKKHKA
ncbi:hypothetical protein CcaverHIS002_0407740 [Cutaneotrichosporon cavernicola]|uniref:Nuclear speckle splicing regulatory protein 1 N-terminal domain-containing protein n=1 Tax=Cutaneotrichosporon cavernicola TaxID=279322 RepID=A0AA48QWA0_9TREE|nr:uncharacterized protein CcaverHIS019_0407720 [Cutaneotrichosporon cavernicola]BEI84170.1 hypothetical protein CcaverHIS002_0407740 [Cutaneotrichosporon cavernicola]BEI91952.1 hypothetical protein CcaverHIS019_0407720 [Cutaneotrichosporon cavernicola]BEI99723.1 hypothetical protein CcaverHIS631_0407660 [Cutaneotrichosporon cavernicola]BEJ07499.1 hypothetical protein CcaverHIS641_0407680 [Cutaneotrichosporon cavernicola]